MVSVGDMFSHRSGLPDHAGDMLEDLGYDRRYVLDRLRDQPLDPFRISYAYTNFGLTQLRRRWPRARVSPGRTSQTSGSSSRWTCRRRATGSPTSRPGATARSATSTSTAATSRSMCGIAQPEAPAGGVSSSVNDMTHWLALMLGRRQLRRKTDRRLQSPAARGDVRRSCPARPASPRCAVGLLRIRLQCRHRHRRRVRRSATRAHSNWAQERTSSSCHPPTWRSSR